MKNHTISIIVPVYNTEKYLRKCLESLVKQTLADIEIIVVNDGSPDNSQGIIDEFVKKYPEKLYGYSKKNGGLGDACNYGIQLSKGEYIGFIASDDYVKPDMFEKMYQKAKTEQAEMVICEFYFVDEEGNFLDQTDITSHNDLSRNDKRYALKYGRTEAFNKIYRKELFTKTGIRYPQGWFEDYPTIPLLIESSNRIAYLNEPLMFYVRREGSIMNQAINFNRNKFDILKATEIIINAKDRFNIRDYIFYLDEIVPVHAFMRSYKKIILTRNAQERTKIIKEWGAKLNRILPGWETSTAIIQSEKKISMLPWRIIYGIIITSFKTGNTNLLNFLLTVRSVFIRIGLYRFIRFVGNTIKKIQNKTIEGYKKNPALL